MTSPAIGEAGRGGADFFSLSRATQERFLMAARGDGVPELLAFRRRARRGNLVLGAGAVVCFLGIFAFASLGFGALRHPLGLQPIYAGAVYVILAVAGVLLAIRSIRAKAAVSASPYALGDYLFEGCVVSARVGKLKCTPLSSVSEIVGRGASVKLALPTGSVVFPLAAGREPALVVERLKTNAKRYAEASAARDVRSLAMLNPLQDSGFANPLSPKVSIPPPARASGPGQGIVLGFACVAALLIFFGRNKLSERALYRAAFDENTVDGYQRYLAQGADRDTVTQLLLPRAELAAARGSATAVGEYLQAHPDSAIRSEVETALRDELLLELKTVGKEDSLASLERFRKRYPQHQLVKEELLAARGAVYRRALERFNETAAQSTELRALAAALLRYAERHGPTVHVRYRRIMPPSVARIERQVRKSKYYVGERSMPSRYFTDEDLGRRELVSSEPVLLRLQAAFPEELLKFKLGAPVGTDVGLPDIEVPTLFVAHYPQMSGLFTTKRPRGVFVGLGMVFKTQFLIPGDDTKFLTRHSFWLPPDLRAINDELLKPVDVYERRAIEAQKRFTAAYLSAWFKNP